MVLFRLFLPLMSIFLKVLGGAASELLIFPANALSSECYASPALLKVNRI